MILVNSIGSYKFKGSDTCNLGGSRGERGLGRLVDVERAAAPKRNSEKNITETNE